MQLVPRREAWISSTTRIWPKSHNLNRIVSFDVKNFLFGKTTEFLNGLKKSTLVFEYSENFYEILKNFATVYLID